MASVRLQPPEPFDLKTPDEWSRWHRQFEQFRHASGLASEDELRQVSTLLYCLGEEADDVLTSTNISEDNRKLYSAVIAKINEHFKVRRNIIFGHGLIVDVSRKESRRSNTLQHSTH